MQPQETLTQLKIFIESHALSPTHLQWIAPDIEIGIEIGEMIAATLVNRDGKMMLLESPPTKPLFTVHAKPQVISAIIETRDIKALSEVLFKEYLAGRLSIERVASWKELIAHGYGWISTLGVTTTQALIRHWKR